MIISAAGASWMINNLPAGEEKTVIAPPVFPPKLLLSYVVCLLVSEGRVSQKKTKYHDFFHLACPIDHGVTTEIHPETSSSKTRRRQMSWLHFEYFAI